MSTFYTAPPIYNTGGWGFRGDIPTFNPTGALDDFSETGKVSVDPIFNLFNQDTFSHLNTKIDFGLDPKFNTAYSPFEGHSAKTSYKINPSIVNASPLVTKIDFGLDPMFNLTGGPERERIASILTFPSFNLTGGPERERVGGILTFPSINNINVPVETSKTIKSFNSLEGANYFGVKNKHKLKTTLSNIRLNTNKLQGTTKLNFSVGQFNYLNDNLSKELKSYVSPDGTNYFLEENINAKDKTSLQSIYHSRTNDVAGLVSTSLSIQKSKIEKSKFEALTSISSSFQHKLHGNIRSTRLKTSNELELNIFKESLMKDIKSYVSHDGTNYFRSSFVKGKTSTLVNLGYNLKEMYEGFFRTTTLPNINTINTPIGKSFGKISVDKLNFYIKPSQKAFFTNTLNQVNYDPIPFSEGQTQSSFPTGLEFPKIRYQTAEPDYTKSSTGSNTYGYIQYEGLDAGNLFFYEPDADSYRWAYFEYNIRSGIFNPCEFPETADRTLDPVQISSRSNKGDNPYWYLPDLLTIDSTIHTADGAPCQYIAQENSRFAEIFLEDDNLLLPENFEQTGQLFEI